MNHEHFRITPSHTKSSAQDAKNFLDELRIALALAQQSLPKGKKLELRCAGLPVRDYTMRPSGLMAVELFEPQSKSTRLILAHYLNLVLECAITDEHQNKRRRPEIGFHAVFAARVGAEGGTAQQ